jgi:hypothetical protein
MTRKDPDIEPFAYPPNYQPAIRNPTALTILGAVLTLVGLAFVGLVIGLVVAPSSTLSWAFILLSLLMPIGFGVILSIGIVRLRWQRAYFRRHGVMPVLIGQRARNS